MRAFDRDLIRGGHYGQRSCEPHSKAEHMAAPTNAALVKKVLANSEPRTLFALPKSWNWRYSPLVRRKETNRIMGAATTTTGSIVTHEMTQDNSQ
jgi:hypothetical protein